MICAIVVERQLAVQRREQVVTLGCEVQRPRDATAQRLHQIGLLRGEEPDGAALVFVVQDLRGHRLAVSFLDAREPEHHGAIALERLPEFRFELYSASVMMSSDVPEDHTHLRRVTWPNQRIHVRACLHGH